MAPVDGGAPIVASAPMPLADAPDLPVHVGDEWKGTYRCAQGRTTMRVVVDGVTRREDDGYDVEATLHFVYDGAQAASGSYRMVGVYRPKQQGLRLTGTEWIEQPSGYVFVSLDGSLSKTGVYSGKVEGPGCTSFSATRVSLPAR